MKTVPQTDTLTLKLTTAQGAAAFNERRVARGIYFEIVETEALSVLPLVSSLRFRSPLMADITFPPPLYTNRIVVQGLTRWRSWWRCSRVAARCCARRARQCRRPIPRAIVRPVWETSVDLRDITVRRRRACGCCRRRGCAAATSSSCSRADADPRAAERPRRRYAADAVPRAPYQFRGDIRREPRDTRPLYKVEIHPPSARLSPNGFPLFTLYNRNDDGGPLTAKIRISISLRRPTASLSCGSPTRARAADGTSPTA